MTVKSTYYFLLKKWTKATMLLENQTKTKRSSFDYIWRSFQPASLLKQGNMEPIARIVSSCFWISLRRKVPQPLCITCVSMLDQPQRKSVFWCSEGHPECQFVHTASGLATAHHWKESGSVLLGICRLIPSNCDKFKLLILNFDFQK